MTDARATSAARYNVLTGDETMLATEPLSPAEQDARTTAAALYRSTKTNPVWTFGLRVRRFLGGRVLARRLPEVLATTRTFAEGYSNLSVGYRFVHLAGLVRALRPRTIVEVGSGISTVFLAALLAEQYRRTGTKGTVITYEQSPEWFEKLVARFPAELKPFVRFNLAPVRYERWGRFRVLYFDVPPPAAEIDLMYIDGPTRPRRLTGDDSPYQAVTGDVVRFLRAGCSVRLAVTDHRWPNLRFFQSELRNTHNVRVSRTVRSIIVSPLERRR